jgi:hypothetical protein
VFGVVCRLHNTEGRSSIQACLAFLSGANKRFLMPLQIRQFAFLTWPLVYGCASDTKCYLMPSPSQ